MPMFDFQCEVCGMPGRDWRQDRPPRFCSRACYSRGKAGTSLKPRKYVITSGMSEAIKQVYQRVTGNGEVRDLAKKLGLPRWKVSRHATAQGWIARRVKEKEWSEKEIAMLTHLAYLSPERIQARLKKAGFWRSISGIVQKRKRQRLSSNLEGQSASKLADCLGIDMHTISKAIQAGKLRAIRRGTNRTDAQGGDTFYIKDKHIREYIINYVDEIDLRKVDKYWLIDVLSKKNDE